MNILQKINILFATKIRCSINSPDYENAFRWMRSLKTPKNLLEASYNQYRCQCYYVWWGYYFIRELCSFFLLIYYLFRFNSKLTQCEEQTDIAIGSWEALPSGLTYKLIESYNGFCLTLEERIEFLKDVLFFGGFYFKLKLLVKVGLYGYYIKLYNPHIIYCTCEYSFTSSYLTMFCKKNKILHYNIQHGEELPMMEYSFYSFDRMYVWGERYIAYSKSVRACVSEYVIFAPFEIEGKREPILFDYKYYLQGQDEAQMEMIFSIMELLYLKGYKVAVRMHPTHNNKSIGKKYKHLIEDAGKPIEKSLLETKCGISMYSTILFHLDRLGKTVIVDDVSDKITYKNLQTVGYIYVTNKLSETIREILRDA